MRDIQRIDEFCNQLANIWKTNCPDWRFGQLIMNVFSSFDIDPFFPEEDQMIQRFEKFFKKGE